MPEYTGGEQLFRFTGKTARGNDIRTAVSATTYKEAIGKVGGWGIHSAELTDTRYLEGVERTQVALYETTKDPFLGPKWTVALDGIHRATKFSAGRHHLQIRFLDHPSHLRRLARPSLRVFARRDGAGRVWIGPPSVIAPADGPNAAVLIELGWEWKHGSLSDGFVMDLEPGWNLVHALHLGIRSLMVCGMVNDDSYLHVLGEAVRLPTVIGWWTEYVEHEGKKLYRIPREWPPPPRHPNELRSRATKAQAAEDVRVEATVSRIEHAIETGETRAGEASPG